MSNKQSHSYFILLVVYLIFFFGPDLFSIIFSGTDFFTNSIKFQLDNWRSVGQDLDLLICKNELVGPTSIWQLVPLEYVLPKIKPLLFILLFQLFCFLILKETICIKGLSGKKNRAKSLFYSLTIILHFSSILFVIEYLYFLGYQKDFILETFVVSTCSYQKLLHHPLFATILFFTSCVGAPIFEEFFFRKKLYSLLRKNNPIWVSVLFNMFFFAMAHFEWNPSSLAMISICGLVNCLIYEKTKSIFGCVCFHMAGNIFIYHVANFYPYDIFC